MLSFIICLRFSCFYPCSVFKKFFRLQNGFLKKISEFFEIGLFVSSDTCKSKVAYTRISLNLTKVGSHWVMLLL